MKNIIVGCVLLFFNGLLFGQSKVNLTILNASEKDGKIYISLFNSESAYNKRQVFRSFTVIPHSESTKITMDIPLGEYLFSVYQDSNRNGKLDYNLIGIPKEKFGFSNYTALSIPGDFEKHKVQIIDISTEIVIHLFKI